MPGSRPPGYHGTMSRTARPGAHEEILEAARVEFARSGLERARVEDIARRAGVSKGAFYLHFSTKEQAFQEILQRFMGALDATTVRRQEAEDRFHAEFAAGDPDLSTHLVEFEASCDLQFLEALWQNRGLLAALDGAGGHAFAQMIDGFRRRTRAFISGRVASRQRIGILRPDVRPEVIGDIVFGAYEAFGRHMSAMAEKPDLEAWARQILLVLYDGMLHRPVGRAAAAQANRPNARPTTTNKKKTTKRASP